MQLRLLHVTTSSYVQVESIVRERLELLVDESEGVSTESEYKTVLNIPVQLNVVRLPRYGANALSLYAQVFDDEVVAALPVVQNHLLRLRRLARRLTRVSIELKRQFRALGRTRAKADEGALVDVRLRDAFAESSKEIVRACKSLLPMLKYVTQQQEVCCG